MLIWVALAAALCVMAGRHAAEMLSTPRYRVTLPGLHGDLEGLRLAHLSDLHGRVTTRWGRDLAGAVKALEPDVVAVTGDLVSRPSQIEAVAEMLGRLHPPLGVFWVTGNHEYLLDPRARSRLVEALARQGATALDGRCEVVERGRGRLWFAGVGWAPHPRLPEIPPRPGEPLVALTHHPDLAEALVPAGAGLVLAGHTHGGQICLPGWGPVIARCRGGRRWARGCRQTGGAMMVVSAGVGTSYLPLRAFCPPEIVLLTLHSPTDMGGDRR